jgi:ribokinase
MTQKKNISPILVVGSSNMDLVVKIQKFPLPGETLLGGEFFMNNGGKGANQAIGVSRLGGNVKFVCKTGRDSFRDKTIDLFSREGIDTRWMLIDEDTPSGVAMIMVDANGENSIVVAPGANGELCVGDMDCLEELWDSTEYLLLQLEIPMATVLYLIRRAAEKGKKVILNPAPAAALPAEIYSQLHVITPNRIEAEGITGIKINGDESIVKAAEVLYQNGVDHVVITLGKDGALLYSGSPTWIPSIPAVAVDTTGAGDVFNAALTVALAEGKTTGDAVAFANKAAAKSITRLGAIPSIPHRNEL